MHEIFVAKNRLEEWTQVLIPGFDGRAIYGRQLIEHNFLFTYKQITEGRPV